MIEWIKDKLASSSPRWSPMMFKATLVSFFALAFIIPLALVATPFIEFFNGMAAQPKAKAQSTYGRVFGEQLLVDRLPVGGTTPRGYETPENAAFGNTIEDATKVGEFLTNPLDVTMGNMQQGRFVYNTYCTTCHGKQGNGDGGVTGINPVTNAARFPAPPSLHTDQVRDYADGTIFHIITTGVGKMPPYGHLIDAEQRWQAVLYVRALQRSMNANEQDTPSEATQP